MIMIKKILKWLAHRVVMLMKILELIKLSDSCSFTIFYFIFLIILLYAMVFCLG